LVFLEEKDSNMVATKVLWLVSLNKKIARFLIEAGVYDEVENDSKKSDGTFINDECFWLELRFLTAEWNSAACAEGCFIYRLSQEYPP
jgi:hypothetical protein